MGIDRRGNAHQGAGAPDGGQFTNRLNSQPLGALTDTLTDLTSQTPADVDEQLADLYYEAFKLDVEATVHADRIMKYRKHIEQGRSPHQHAEFETWIEREQVERDRLAGEADAVRAQMRPFEAEYRRRGGWTRAFLVTGGHLHNTMDCSTCNRMGQPTRFSWMPELSGSDEQEMVEAAGERCCTVCFPSAPVDLLKRPSILLTPDEEAAARARAERDLERARKAEEKAAKAITNPDGTELREPRKYGQIVRTLVTAERELTDALMTAIVDDVPEHSHWNRDWVAEQAEWANLLVTAVAAKKGITEDEVRAAAQVKAQAKFKREYRQ